MVKACAADLPHVIDKEFAGTSSRVSGATRSSKPYVARGPPTLTEARPQSALSAGDVDIARLRSVPFRSPCPFPFQEEILDRLAAERAVHGRHRNLVVAATGTGKTVIAAFDYLTPVRERPGVAWKPRLLFLAHRREILWIRLSQDVSPRDSARSRRLPANCGRTAHKTPERWRPRVFATHPRAPPGQPPRPPRPADHYRFVIVDEALHHVPAASVLSGSRPPRCVPSMLLGLTATPGAMPTASRSCRTSTAASPEIRLLWHRARRSAAGPVRALRGLRRCPTSQGLRWSRTGYDAGATCRRPLHRAQRTRRSDPPPARETRRRPAQDPRARVLRQHRTRRVRYRSRSRPAGIPSRAGVRQHRRPDARRLRPDSFENAPSTSCSRATSTMRASIFRSSTRSYFSDRRRARRCSCSNSGADCVITAASHRAWSSTSSASIATNSDST